MPVRPVILTGFQAHQGRTSFEVTGTHHAFSQRIRFHLPRLDSNQDKESQNPMPSMPAVVFQSVRESEMAVNAEWIAARLQIC